MPVSEKPTVANTGGFPLVDVKLTYAGNGWLVEYDMGDGMTLSEYKLVKQTAAQLRHSLGGSVRIHLRGEDAKCQRLAKRLGFIRRGTSFIGNGIWEHPGDA